MRIFTTKRFDREQMALLKSHRLDRSRMQALFIRLAENPRHPSLRLHKLSGTSNYAISVTKDIRIIFNREDDMLFLSRIGSHDEVY